MNIVVWYYTNAIWLCKKRDIWWLPRYLWSIWISALIKFNWRNLYSTNYRTQRYGLLLTSAKCSSSTEQAQSKLLLPRLRMLNMPLPAHVYYDQECAATTHWSRAWDKCLKGLNLRWQIWSTILLLLFYTKFVGLPNGQLIFLLN